MGTITNISADQTGSAQARWRDMIAALEVVLENPVVGFGVGMNLLALNEERGATWTAVHNVYLQYAVELGLPGLVLFLLLLGGCFKNVAWVQRRAARIPSWRELFYLAEGLQISLLAFTVAALFHPVAYHFYFYYVAGLAVAAKALCQRDLEGEW
jgi:O-antigen ligase